MAIKIIEKPIAKKELIEAAKTQFGDFLKAVVDVEREIMALGGELHADEESLLLEHGSRQENLWGVNLYPEKLEEDGIEFDSIINVRPLQDNHSRGVENQETRVKIKEIINKLIL
jgi:hypothetical protein